MLDKIDKFNKYCEETKTPNCIQTFTLWDRSNDAVAKLDKLKADKQSEADQTMQQVAFSADVVKKYSDACQQLAKIKSIAECGSVDSFMACSDEVKRNYFAIMVMESAENKKLKAEREQMEKQEPVPEELRIDTFHQGNKSGFDTRPDICVRVTHLPSGLFAESTTERSVWSNRAKAMAELKAKLYARPPVPDGKVLDMAKVLMGFLAEQRYLHHPDVPYNGTENGDSPAEWNLRLHEAAVKVMLKAAQQGE